MKTIFVLPHGRTRFTNTRLIRTQPIITDSFLGPGRRPIHFLYNLPLKYGLIRATDSDAQIAAQNLTIVVLHYYLMIF